MLHIMKLKHITFTGIDHLTDLDALEQIQQRYPFVEWGVLLSHDWKANGNRYFNPQYLPVFKFRHLRLSAHLCGRLAYYAAINSWQQVYNVTGPFFDVFRRCQLNVANLKYPIERCDVKVPYTLDEVIIQQRSASDCDFFLSGEKNEQVTVLLDASGGQGIDTPIEVLPFDGKTSKVGYAGGINADNVGEKLQYLLENDSVGDFWIDMESGVRTDDWFNLNKVHDVLEECKWVLKMY